MPEVKDLFRNVGIPVFFLIPYCPDYNPIEDGFSYVKGYLREHDILVQTVSDPCSVVESAFNRITPHLCNQLIT